MNWKGNAPVQVKMPGMPFTSVLQVQSSKGSKLLREIAKIEPRLAKSTGYHVKLVERSGKPLSNMFSKSISSSKCHRSDCTPCSNSQIKGSFMCKVKSVVYEGVCNLCEAEFNLDKSLKHKGKYIGQTSRSLYERCGEHETSYRRMESKSFMFKHWAVAHSDLTTPPTFSFKVLKCHRDPLSRMVHEAVSIQENASMNSKSEHKSYKIARIKVEKSSWDDRKEIEDSERVDKPSMLIQKFLAENAK